MRGEKKLRPSKDETDNPLDRIIAGPRSGAIASHPTSKRNSIGPRIFHGLSALQTYLAVTTEKITIRIAIIASWGRSRRLRDVRNRKYRPSSKSGKNAAIWRTLNNP